jgi:hypothetical protein
MKIVMVLAVGALLGVVIELALTRRQRARQVVLDKPDGLQAPMAAQTRVVVDEEGFKILGPVTYDEPPRSSIPAAEPDEPGKPGESVAIEDTSDGE